MKAGKLKYCKLSNSRVQRNCNFKFLKLGFKSGFKRPLAKAILRWIFLYNTRITFRALSKVYGRAFKNFTGKFQGI